MRQCFPKCVPRALSSQDLNKYICKMTSKEFEKQGVAWIALLIIFQSFEYTNMHWSPWYEVTDRVSQSVNEDQFGGLS